MTQTVTVTQASIADLIEQRDELLERLIFAVAILEEARFRVDYAPGSLGQIEIDEAIDTGYAAISKASPIAGLTEIGEEEAKNSTRSQSEPVLTPKCAIGDAENGGPMHTPGPWSTFSDYDLSLSGEGAEGEPIHSWVCVGNPDCANGEVAIVMGWDPSFQDDEMDANIALIAAAPDLLEALRDLLVLEGGRFGTGVIKPGTYGAAVINAARDAIAEAEGRPLTSRSAPDDGALAPITPGHSGRTQP